MTAASLSARALLFDLDGVLVDSIAGVELAWREWANMHALDADTVLAAVHGRRAADVVALLMPELDVRSEVQALSHREAGDVAGLYPIVGAAQLVSQLPSNRWAVVTSGTRAVATFRLGVGNVPMPAVMITAEDVARGKPDPQGYLLGAALLGIAPVDCVVVEDAPAGIAAATAAGMRSIGVASTFDETALSGATMMVRTLSQLVVRVEGDVLHLSVAKST